MCPDRERVPNGPSGSGAGVAVSSRYPQPAHDHRVDAGGGLGEQVDVVVEPFHLPYRVVGRQPAQRVGLAADHLGFGGRVGALDGVDLVSPWCRRRRLC
jgi:hypothetical protein